MARFIIHFVRKAKKTPVPDLANSVDAPSTNREVGGKIGSQQENA